MSIADTRTLGGGDTASVASVGTYRAPKFILVPLASQERENHILKDLRVLQMIKRDDKLLCGVGVAIESTQWLMQQKNRLEWPFIPKTPGREIQGRELTSIKTGIIMDDATQHSFILLQHIQHKKRGHERSVLVVRLENVIQNVEDALPGVIELSQTTYSGDIDFETNIVPKVQNILRNLDVVVRQLHKLIGREPKMTRNVSNDKFRRTVVEDDEDDEDDGETVRVFTSDGVAAEHPGKANASGQTLPASAPPLPASAPPLPASAPPLPASAPPLPLRASHHRGPSMNRLSLEDDKSDDEEDSDA
jgi:hypothetical protein